MWGVTQPRLHQRDELARAARRVLPQPPERRLAHLHLHRRARLVQLVERVRRLFEGRRRPRARQRLLLRRPLRRQDRRLRVAVLEPLPLLDDGRAMRLLRPLRLRFLLLLPSLLLPLLDGGALAARRLVDRVLLAQHPKLLLHVLRRPLRRFDDLGVRRPPAVEPAAVWVRPSELRRELRAENCARIIARRELRAEVARGPHQCHSSSTSETHSPSPPPLLNATWSISRSRS